MTRNIRHTLTVEHFLSLLNKTGLILAKRGYVRGCRDLLIPDSGFVSNAAHREARGDGIASEDLEPRRALLIGRRVASPVGAHNGRIFA